MYIMIKDDLFTKMKINPMLIGASSQAFNDDNYIFELKWDGERCIAYLDHNLQMTELRNKRNVKMLPKVPELSLLHRQVNQRCILDGELMTLVDGKPDFSTIQRRSLMANKFKIDMESKKHPATFVVFDILYLSDKNILLNPLLERKELLSKTVIDGERMAISRYIEYNGISFFDIAKERNLEGVVAKKNDSIYVPGKRTKDWIKIKNLLDDDFVVCGWIRKRNNMNSIVLGKYSEGKLIYKGHVTLGVSGKEFRNITQLPKIDQPYFEIPEGNENAIWVIPELVCTVKFMERTARGGMRQPTFKCLRYDKSPEECLDL